MSLAVDGIRAIVLAAVRVLATVYAFAMYRQSRGDVMNEAPEGGALSEMTSARDGLAKATVWFTFASFLPLLHFLPLVLGILAIRRKRQFVLGPVIACCIGGFFTLFYFLLVAGWLVSASATSASPGYTLLSEVNAGLKPQVFLLEQRSFREAQQQLEQNPADGSGRHWSLDAALALAKYQGFNLQGALKDFSTAAEKTPA